MVGAVRSTIIRFCDYGYGFDLGAMILLPFLGRKDIERRVVINTIGPVWEGNQVWFITAGGSLFAAWPLLYAVSFSGFYFAMFLVLSALIVRPVSIKYRSKMPSIRWRTNWDRCCGDYRLSACFSIWCRHRQCHARSAFLF